MFYISMFVCFFFNMFILVKSVAYIQDVYLSTYTII